MKQQLLGHYHEWSVTDAEGDVIRAALQLGKAPMNVADRPVSALNVAPESLEASPEAP